MYYACTMLWMNAIEPLLKRAVCRADVTAILNTV